MRAIELGSYLVDEAGLYVCRGVDRKVSPGHIFLITDGGLHHHLAASGKFGQVLRKNFPVAIGNRMDFDAVEVASVVGPLCTPLDVLADRVALPMAREGELIVVYESDAYGLNASPLRFLGQPGPREILVCAIPSRDRPPTLHLAGTLEVSFPQPQPRQSS